ncbi:MAG: T9SS type A sorting domain-containing protein, partial [Pedobacter sp.]
AGKHEFEWEFANNNISAGMYILVLQVDSKTYTRKVIVQ